MNRRAVERTSETRVERCARGSIDGTEEEDAKPRILDVGCGFRKTPGSIGLDNNPRTAADISHDLNEIPYPIASNSFDVIVCRHILEHLPNTCGVMEELHRIGRPGARVEITVPFYRSRWAFTDPGHVHFFTALSFDYFVRGTELASCAYTDKWFDLEKLDYRMARCYRRFSGFREFLDRHFLEFVNKRKSFYEAYLAPVLPVDEIRVELRVVKEGEEDSAGQ